jgi:hypothetical protein
LTPKSRRRIARSTAAHVGSISDREAPTGTSQRFQVALWDLAADRVNYTEFNVGPTWTEVTVGMDNPGSRIRAEIYLNTIEQWLDVDGVVLV